MRTLLLIALAALTLQAAPSVAAAPAPTDWTLPRLTVENRTIKDVDGRTVLLRGPNINQLNDYAPNGTGLPTVAPLDDTDFARMAALGFNVVRLNVAWSALEPSPGAFDSNAPAASMSPRSTRSSPICRPAFWGHSARAFLDFVCTVADE